MNIRFAKNEDLNILSKLETHIDYDMIRRKINNGEIIIISVDNKIVGWLRYSLFWDEHPFINMIFFLEKYRGKGFGKRLISFWESEMKKNNHNILITSTQSDENAQFFFRKLGYKDAGGFIIKDEPFELVMIKEIPKC